MKDAYTDLIEEQRALQEKIITAQQRLKEVSKQVLKIRDAVVRAQNGQGAYCDVCLKWRSGLSREQMIGLMVMESRAACSLPEPTTEDLMAMRAAWARVLQDVPTRFLERCFASASRQHAGPYAMTAYEVAAVWRAACASGLSTQWFAESERALQRPDCELCLNTGWQPIDVPGQGWTSKRCSCGR